MCSSSRSKPASSRHAASRARTRRARGPCRRGPSRAATGQPCANGSADGRERRPARPSRSGVVALPRQRARALAPRVRELHADLRARCARARSRRCASTPRRARRSYMPVQPCVMRPSRATSCHLGEHEPRAADRAAAEVHEVPVVRRAVLARVLAHRRHDDAVGERAAPRSRNGANSGGRQPCRRMRRGARRSCVAPRTRSVTRRDERGIARAQVVVRDALAARHQVERERAAGRWRSVARGVLEPLEAGLRRALQPAHARAARGLVGRERRRHVAVPVLARTRRPARSRPPSRASCPSRSRSARCAPRRR